MRCNLLAYPFILGAALATSSAAQFFESSYLVDVGDFPADVLVADLDGDDLPDVILANPGNGSLSLLRGNGFGDLAPVTKLASGQTVTQVAVGDLNGDGLRDVAATLAGGCCGEPPRVSVYLGLGDYQFAPRVDYPAGALPSGLVLGDFTGDGQVDVFTSNRAGQFQGATLLAGDGAGGFGPQQAVTSSSFREGVVNGDLDADGDQDVVLWQRLGPTIFQHNDGSGSFGPAFNVGMDGGVLAADVGDLNNDGLLDVVGASDSAASISIELGTPSGFFTDGLNVPMVLPTDVWLHDLDLDGSLDLAVAHGDSGGELAVRLGLGDGTFDTMPLSVDAAAGLADLAVFDVDGNGRADVVGTSGSAQQVEIFRNLTAGHWDDLGGGTSGLNGAVRLLGQGPQIEDEIIGLSLSQAPPNALALLWISLDAGAPQDILGGTMYATQATRQVLLLTDAEGRLSGETTYREGVPMGTRMWFQFLCQDASSVHGITLSNGVLATAP